MLTAVVLCADTSCRQSADDRMVGIWQFSGMDATMDYVFKRLNIEIDTQGVITGVRCG